MRDDRSRTAERWSLLGRLRGRGRRGRGRPAVRPEDWQRVLRGRLLVGLTAFGVWFLAIESRLVYLQVIRHEQLVERAERQQSRSITAHPQRGEIRDREGRVLAYSVDSDTVYAVPTDIDDPAATATALCNALDACSEARRQVLERRLGQRRAFAYVGRKVSPEAARRVAALGLDGVGFLKEDRRFYPNRELAGHLIGYVGIDNQGLGGVESTYDHEISGRPGKMLIQTDARRRAFSRVERLPTTGATIELTIDKYLQYVAERELRAAVRRHDAAGGTVVMLDPHTGELLAVANEPSFNPNAFSTAPAAALRNRAVQDVYEPGSAFKLVTTSAALQEGVARRDELFDVSAGVIRVGGQQRLRHVHLQRPLAGGRHREVEQRRHDRGRPAGGPGAPQRLRAPLRIREDAVARPARRERGHRPPPREPDRSGRGVHLHGLSGGRHAAATGGGGGGRRERRRAAGAPAPSAPSIRDGRRTERPRRVIRQAIAPETAAELTGIMEAVVERGTARAARIPGYAVAGKTGTAEKLIDGRYSNVDHNATFVGFAPARAPLFAMAVMIDTPRGARYTGGAVAAPVFKRVAEAALRYPGRSRDDQSQPPVLVRRAATVGADPVAARRAALPVRAAAADAAPGRRVMPDLRGLSARRALEALGPLHLGVRLDGDGFVTTQQPGPGEPVGPGTIAALSLERRSRYLRGDTQ